METIVTDKIERKDEEVIYQGLLAYNLAKIIGTSGMSFVEKPPYFGCPSGKMGLLSSMFTNSDYSISYGNCKEKVIEIRKLHMICLKM